MVNFGVIGYGKFGKAHAGSIKAVEEVKLVAISARSKESCSRARDDFGVDTCQDYRELLQRKDIDAVSIVVPNYLHYQVALDAFEAGKHVLLEKPMALAIEECEEIIEFTFLTWRDGTARVWGSRSQYMQKPIPKLMIRLRWIISLL